MNRGEVWWVRFGPSVGEEMQKVRPAIIISNDASNKHLRRLQVIPLTSRVGRLYPGEAYVTLNGKQAKALANQLTTVSKLRVSNIEGRLSEADMTTVETAIKAQLGLKT